MAWSCLNCEFLSYLIDEGFEPGERLPSLVELSNEIGISVGKLREQLEMTRMLGLVEASPRRGITRKEYSFLPPVQLSLLTALRLDRSHFKQFSNLRTNLEAVYWEAAVDALTDADKRHLQKLVQTAQLKLTPPRIQIPYPEHRQLHLAIFSRLDNPFVLGLLEAYWDAYEAVELNTYADIGYLNEVWDYHERIVDAICNNEVEEGRLLLVEHMNLIKSRGIAVQVGMDHESITA